MLASFFNLDNPVFKFLSKVVDLAALNLLFVFSCLPLFTIGAALTSLQYVMITGWDTQDSHLIKMYTTSIKQNFKQSTILWLVMLVIGVFLGFTAWMIYQQSKVDDGILFMIFIVIFVVLAIIYACIFTYVWPLLAKFENNTKTTVKNALLLAVSHLPHTLILWVVFGVAAYFIYRIELVRDFAYVILCSVVAYIQSFVFRRVFAPFLEEKQGSI